MNEEDPERDRATEVKTCSAMLGHPTFPRETQPYPSWRKKEEGFYWKGLIGKQRMCYRMQATNVL